MAGLLEQLEREHMEVASLLDELEVAEEPEERDGLLTAVETMLLEHMRVEEQDVYPLLRRIDQKQVEAAENEHGSVRQLLDQLREEGTGTPGFGALVAALRGAIEHHVSEEELEAFPALREAFGDDLRGGGAERAKAPG